MNAAHRAVGEHAGRRVVRGEEVGVPACLAEVVGDERVVLAARLVVVLGEVVGDPDVQLGSQRLGQCVVRRVADDAVPERPGVRRRATHPAQEVAPGEVRQQRRRLVGGVGRVGQEPAWSDVNSSPITETRSSRPRSAAGSRSRRAARSADTVGGTPAAARSPCTCQRPRRASSTPVSTRWVAISSTNSGLPPDQPVDRGHDLVRARPGRGSTRATWR